MKIAILLGKMPKRPIFFARDTLGCSYSWHASLNFYCSLGGSTSVRASQLINARGKKLNVVSKSTKATQTASILSTSASMASVNRNRTPTIQDQNQNPTSALNSPIVVPHPTSAVVLNSPVAPSNGQTAQLKDRTLFQRLFQR